MTRIKICGITNQDDALHACRCGADALGFVFAPSPRRISVRAAAAIIRRLPPFVVSVGVFVDEDAATVWNIQRECRLPVLQFHGGETDEYCAEFRSCCKIIKAIRLRDEHSIAAAVAYTAADAVLFDAYVPDAAGGTGQPINAELLKAADMPLPMIIAGGLREQTVGAVISEFSPYAVDVSSGVEIAPGKKDPDKVRRMIALVHGYGGVAATASEIHHQH